MRSALARLGALSPRHSEPLDRHESSTSSYETVRALGSGTFGKVYLAKDKRSGKLVALKFIDRQSVGRYVEREVTNHLKLRHPHVIALLEVFATRKNLVLVMDYAAGGDLFAVVQRAGGLQESDARRHFHQIVVAVDYCHRMGICSRDIKLENTLLDGAAVKLCDFGFSKDAGYHSAPVSRVGTPAYRAPEVITAPDEGDTYDGAVADVWSCGVLLYAMVCGSYPFTGQAKNALKPTHNVVVLIQNIQAAQYSFPADKALSPEFKDLIRRMLVVDPAKRASLREVMQHPWYRVDVPPALLTLNDALVAKSKAEPVAEEALARVEKAMAAVGLRPSGRRSSGGGSSSASNDSEAVSPTSTLQDGALRSSGSS